jgi:flavin-dependent dehydrogenase
MLVIDRAAFPRDKACGDGLGPGARRTLEELDLSHLLEGFSRPVSVALTGPDDIEARATGPLIKGKDLSGFVAPRLEFDNRLVDECLRRGIDVRTGQKFTELSELANGQVSASWKDEKTGEMASETFDFIVGADGAYSTVRKATGLQSAKKSKTHVAMRSYASISHPTIDVANTLRLDFLDALLPAYGWVFPLQGGRANIGIGIPISRLQDSGKTLKELLSRYYEDLRRRGFSVGDPEDVKAHQLPHAGAHLKMTKGHVLLIGDASATINPFSGEGIFYGMAAGVQLARQVGAMARDPGIDWATVRWDRELMAFERSFKSRFRKHFFNSYMAHQMLKSKTWARIVTRAAAKDEDIMATGAFMMFDENSISVADVARVALNGFQVR